MFRDDFVWGVASSAYQVEGRDPEDGCGKNIWDTFAEEGRILDGKDAYTACDHMHRYKEDYKLKMCIRDSFIWLPYSVLR